MTRRTSLLIDSPPLQVLKPLAVRLGLNEALVLQQLHYLLQQRRGRPVELSYKEWKLEHFPFWSVATIRRAFTTLSEHKLVVKAQANGADRTAQWSLDYAALEALEADSRASAQIEHMKRSDRALGSDQSERFHASASGSPKAEEQQEDPLAPYIEDFRGWLSHHWATTQIGQPQEGSDEWRDVLWAYAKARREGFSPSDLQLVVEGAWRDEFSHRNTLYTHDQVLKPSKLRRRLEMGRKLTGQAEAPGPKRTNWTAWADEHFSDLSYAGIQYAAQAAQMLDSAGHEVTVDAVRARIDRLQGEAA